MTISAEKIGAILAFTEVLERIGWGFAHIVAARKAGITNEQLAAAIQTLLIIKAKHDTLHLNPDGSIKDV